METNEKIFGAWHQYGEGAIAFEWKKEPSSYESTIVWRGKKINLKMFSFNNYDMRPTGYGAEVTIDGHTFRYKVKWSPIGPYAIVSPNEPELRVITKVRLNATKDVKPITREYKLRIKLNYFKMVCRETCTGKPFGEDEAPYPFRVRNKKELHYLPEVKTHNAAGEEFYVENDHYHLYVKELPPPPEPVKYVKPVNELDIDLHDYGKSNEESCAYFIKETLTVDYWHIGGSEREIFTYVEGEQLDKLYEELQVTTGDKVQLMKALKANFSGEEAMWRFRDYLDKKKINWSGMLELKGD